MPGVQFAREKRVIGTRYGNTRRWSAHFRVYPELAGIPRPRGGRAATIVRAHGVASALFVASLLIAGPSEVSWSAELSGRPEDYRAIVKQLKPGDRLVLEPGAYRDGLRLHGIQGESDARIVIEGPAEGPRAVFYARDGANTISIANSSYITIRNLELDGLGLPVDAVKAEGSAAWAHHITLEGLRIVNHGVDQSTVGIATHCTTWDWVIRGNEIIGAGTGMYLGSSRGDAPFVAGLIEYNLVSGTLGYNIQIKQQDSRPVIDGLPGEPRQTVVRHNVFTKGTNSTVGEQARPNVLIGHLPLRGTGADDDYLVYGNFFYGNPTEALFQGEGNVALYNNVFLNPFGAAVVIQPHNDVPRAIRIFQNTVLAARGGIRFVGFGGDSRQSVSRNLVFASPPFEAFDTTGNVTGSLIAADRYLDNPKGRLGEDLRLWPKGGVRFKSGTKAPKLQDAEVDFDGNLRTADDSGAYVKSAVRRWKLQLSRKPAQ